MRAGRTCGVAVTLALAGLAYAEPDSFGLGDGHRGALTVADAGVVINSYTLLTADCDAGCTVLQVPTTAGFASGDLVLVHQVKLAGPGPDSGTPGPFDLSDSPVGRFELARLSSAGGGTLALTAPLTQPFPAMLTQVVSVPEHTTVAVLSGGSIVAKPWDGLVGGLVAFLASGEVVNDGVISATGAGFRGGVAATGPGGTGCTGLDALPPNGAPKGEGVVDGRYGVGSTGRGNVLNGAGGGNCDSSGGGGGGHGGMGGMGGDAQDAVRLDIGGYGGAALQYAPTSRLLLGGGGGAGHQRYNLLVGSSGGGRGGGVVLLRAARLAGSGTIAANGTSGWSPSSQNGIGGSGGGAGGLIALRLAADATCGAVLAEGRNGGLIINDITGPGGGGSGGVILLQSSAPGACPASVLAGVAGTQNQTADPHRGATPSSPFSPAHLGRVFVLPGGYGAPPVPTLLSPADQSIAGARPAFAGSAQPESNVIIYVDDREIGRVAATDGGSFSFDPAEDLTDGVHRGQVAGEKHGALSARSAPNVFLVMPGMEYKVGCDCQTSPTLVLTLLCTLVALARRQFQRQRRIGALS